MHDLGIIKAMNNERTKENNMTEQSFKAGDKVRVLTDEYLSIPKNSVVTVAYVLESVQLVFAGDDELAFYTWEVEKVKEETRELPEATLDSILEFVENLIDRAYPDEDPDEREDYKQDVSYQILGTMSEQWIFGFDVGANTQLKLVQEALDTVEAL